MEVEIFVPSSWPDPDRAIRKKKLYSFVRSQRIITSTRTNNYTITLIPVFPIYISLPHPLFDIVSLDGFQVFKHPSFEASHHSTALDLHSVQTVEQLNNVSTSILRIIISASVSITYFLFIFLDLFRHFWLFSLFC